MLPRVLLASALVCATYAQTYQPTASNLKARNDFQNRKFGLFIHWGVYTVLGKGEWVMDRDKISATEYEKIATQFDPTEFNAAAWVAMAKDAGMKYITITSKHHDGFAMWGTKRGSYDIVDRTPYGKDVIKMLADECHRQGIKLFFYYSQLDWHNASYYPLGRTGHTAERPEGGDWEQYLEYMNNQLRELLTNYGEIGGIWFDGMWDKPDAAWHLEKTYALIHSLQPAALIGSNHHLTPFDGEDFQMFERDLPGQNTAGFSGKATIGKLPLESCDTINGAWGYNATDKQFKSAKQLVTYLVRAAGNNANFLLNIGPMPTGKIQPEFTQRLHEIGEWMGKNGESIYGTRGGPITPRPWGVTTQTKDKIYLHILDWQDSLLALPPLPKVRNARVMAGGQPVELRATEGGTLLRIPDSIARDPFDTVIVMDKVQ